MDLKFACPGEMGKAATGWSSIFHNRKKTPLSSSSSCINSATISLNVVQTSQSNPTSLRNQIEVNGVAHNDTVSYTGARLHPTSKSDCNDSVVSSALGVASESAAVPDNSGRASSNGNSSSSANCNQQNNSVSGCAGAKEPLSSIANNNINNEDDVVVASASVSNNSSCPTSKKTSLSLNCTNVEHSNSITSTSSTCDVAPNNAPHPHPIHQPVPPSRGSETTSSSCVSLDSNNHAQFRGQKEAAVYSRTPWIVDGKMYPATVVGLHEEIFDFFNWICPTEPECFMRNEVVGRICNAVNKVWPSAVVEVYGSYKSGLYLPTSDIDISIMLLNCSSLDIAKCLILLEKQLKTDNICNENGAKVLPHAVVPIIKLTDRLTNVRVDISLNIQNAANSARLVSEFIRKYPPLPYLVLVLKQFLLQRDLNEVYQGGLSSYSLILMVVSFLQLHPRAEGCKNIEVNYGVLLIEFFELYGKNMNYLKAGIRVSDGGSYVPRKERQDAPFLSIEDPLDKENDIGKVSWAAQIVKDAFEYAYYVLSRAVTSLTGTHVSSFLSKIISINEETQDYRRWINENWKDRQMEHVHHFAPYFTNYDNNYNPYLNATAAAAAAFCHAGGNMLPNAAATSSVGAASDLAALIPLAAAAAGLQHNPKNGAVVFSQTPAAQSANSGSVCGGNGAFSSNNSSSSSHSTVSDSENSGNGVEQSSCYSNGSATDVGNVTALAASTTAANVGVSKRASANMDYQGGGQHRHRNEKRQAIAASGNSHQTYSLVPKYLAPHGAPYNERPYPNERMTNHNRHHNRNSNWSRRHANHNNGGGGGFTNHINDSNLVASSNGGNMHPNYQHHNIATPNSMLNLASGGPGNGGGVNGVGNKKRGHNQLRTYQNSSGSFSNNVNNSNLNNSANGFSRNAASPLNISSKSQQQQMQQQQQQAHAMLISATGNSVASTLPPTILTQQLANVMTRQQPHLVMQFNHQSLSTPPLPSPQMAPSQFMTAESNTYTRKTNKNGVANCGSSKSREMISEVGSNYLNMQYYYDSCSVAGSNTSLNKSTINVQSDAGLCGINDGGDLENVTAAAAGNGANASTDANNCPSANAEIRIMRNIPRPSVPSIGDISWSLQQAASGAYDPAAVSSCPPVVESDEQQRASSRLNQSTTPGAAEVADMPSFRHIMNAVPPSSSSACSPTGSASNLATAQTGHSSNNLHNVAIPCADSSFDEFDNRQSVKEKPRSNSCINKLTLERVSPESDITHNSPSPQTTSSSTHAQSSNKGPSSHITEEEAAAAAAASEERGSSSRS